MRPSGDVPTALVRPARGPWVAWLLPLLAAVLSVYLAISAWGERGVMLRVHARDGYGIRAGDPLRYRGIAVGEVERVELAPGLDEVLLLVRLDTAASALARAGSRFWVVRPHVSLDSVQGLETILGARHLAVLPGPEGAERQREFVALEEPPVADSGEEGGLEIVLEAPARFGLAPGAPVSYRQIQVGSIVAVGLSSDATAVEIRARIRAPYRELVRDNSVFWEVGGVELSLGMGGLRVDLDSFRALFVGGVAMATPTRPGAPVRTGQRFPLEDEPEEEWLEWQPALALGNELLPAGAPRPELLRARVDWDPGLFHRSRSRNGWLLPVPTGVIGPRDLLAPDAEEAALEVRGERLPLDVAPAAVSAGLARRTIRWPAVPAWRPDRVRELDETEDLLVWVDPAVAPVAVSGSRLAREDEGWRIDPAITFDDEWHGAAVLARADGLLVGILLVEKGRARIAPVSGELFGE